MKKFDEMPITEANVVFYCSTSVLDEMVLIARGETFDKEMADLSDADSKGFYFVVDYNGDYTVIPMAIIDKLGFPSGDQSSMATHAMHYYIQSLGI